MVAIKPQPAQSRTSTFVIIILLLVICILLFYDSDCWDAPIAADKQLLARPASPPPKGYQLAFRESFGFFTDVSDKDWLHRKSISQKVVHNYVSPQEVNFPHHSASWWHQLNWNPDFACFLEEAVGGNDDGKKYVCDPHRLPLTDCLVYSFGSNGDFGFEVGVNLVAPQCEIHVFDPGNYAQTMERSGVKNAHYHRVGLKSSYAYNATAVKEKSGQMFQSTFRQEDMKTLQEVVQMLGHKGRRIDLFKIDVEGAEWRSYKDWLDFDLRQILVEVHNQPLVANDFFWDLHKLGYVIFHKEPNIQWSGGDCVEFSMLKLHPEFFQKTWKDDAIETVAS